MPWGHHYFPENHARPGAPLSYIHCCKRRHPKLLLQQRHCRHQLHQRRMLGIQTVVAAMPHHVTGENMVALIERERIAMNDDRNQEHLQDDQSACKGPDVPYLIQQ
jgi:hypothetical protein